MHVEMQNIPLIIKCQIIWHDSNTVHEIAIDDLQALYSLYLPGL